MKKKERVVLAYSGGLDTSVILKWLGHKGYEVVCFVGNVGQNEDFDAIARKARATGAVAVYVEDLREEFVSDFVFTALRANAIYEGRYLLGTALARPLLAKRQVEIAAEEKTHLLSHGATGKGNDQVRFELTYYALNPHAVCISPWKDPQFLSQFKGRSDLLRFASEWGIPVKASLKNSYSEDENLMHISHEAGVLENPEIRAPEEIYSMTTSPQKAPDRETSIEIEFHDGIPVRVTHLGEKKSCTDPLEMFIYLNELGSKNGIGRIDIVENRFVGIKSRGVYETPGATILWTAHRDLECLAMDREVMRLRDMLSPKFSELAYNGFWFSPEADFLIAAFNKSQEDISGWVRLSLYKGNASVTSRFSPVSLYNEELSSMDAEGGFNGADSRGFININAIRLRAHNLVLKRKRPYGWREKAQTHHGK